MKKLFEAIEFATNAHNGQLRKGSNVPYITHPMRVMTRLSELCMPEAALCAAVLHDVVEDTPHTIQEIEDKFGARVAEIVVAVSEPDKSLSWDERKKHTIAEIKNCKDEEVLHLICADKLDNLLSMQREYAFYGEFFWSRFNAPKEKQKWYYQSLAHEFIQNGLAIKGSIFAEFCYQVQRMFEPVGGSRFKAILIVSDENLEKSLRVTSSDSIDFELKHHDTLKCNQNGTTVDVFSLPAQSMFDIESAIKRDRDKVIGKSGESAFVHRKFLEGLLVNLILDKKPIEKKLKECVEEWYLKELNEHNHVFMLWHENRDFFCVPLIES